MYVSQDADKKSIANDLQEMLDKMPEAFRKLLPLQKGSKDITKDMVDETLKLLETILMLLMQHT